jgi:hypothetical protein
MLSLQKMNLIELNTIEATEIDGGKNWFQKNWDSAVKDVLNPIRDANKETLGGLLDFIRGGRR